MDTSGTPTYNSKLLKTIFGGYAFVLALSFLVYILQNVLDHFGNAFNIGFDIITNLICIALVGLAAIAGKRIGLKTLGRVAAWIGFPLLLISCGITIFWYFLQDDRGFVDHEYSNLLRILAAINLSLLFLIAICLTLMAIGSKLKTLPMITFLVTVWLSWCLNLTFTYWSYNLYECFGESYYLIFMIIRAIFWTASGIITLCLPTRQ